MESSIMNGMCRCCASEGVFKDVKTSYTWMGEEEVYADMLKDCFDINLSTSDTIEDGGICEVCITQLRNASNFKKQVLNTEEQFKKHALNKLFKPNIVKVEVNADDDDNDSDDNVLSGEEGYSGPEYEVPIKTESDDPKPKKRAAASKATTSRAKKAKTDSGESSTKRPPPAVFVKMEIEEIQLDNAMNIEIEVPAPTNTAPKLKDYSLFKHRNNIKEVLLSSNATPIRRYGDLGFMCCYCDEHFMEAAELKSHTLETHHDVHEAYFMSTRRGYQYVIKLDITALQCKLCDENIDKLEVFMEHLKKVHDKTIFYDVKNHIIPFKFETEKWQCAICFNIFGKFRMLIEHMNQHYRNYVCEICDAGFANFGSLKTHRSCHDIGSYKCEYCTQSFENKSKRRLHERSKHGNKKWIIRCGHCNETFNDYRKKEAHLVSVHGGKMHKCQSCDKVFMDSKALNNHVRRNHLMERPHKCAECEMSFFKSTELRNHMVKHTGIRSYTCSVCTKAFGRAKTLRQHMKIHYNERGFNCDHCGQSFVQKCTWRVHMRSKHGEIV